MSRLVMEAQARGRWGADQETEVLELAAERGGRASRAWERVGSFRHFVLPSFNPSYILG